ncbi:MAG: surface lipoprotein assembly modifier [Nitrospinaceae bacterium]
MFKNGSKTFWIFFAGISLACLGLGKVPPADAQSLEKKGKNWNVKLRTQLVVEDNLAQNPDGSPPLTIPGSDGGWNGNGTAAFTYRHDKKFSVTADYDIDITVYQDLGEFDLIAQMWGVKPKYRFNSRMFLELQYFYIWNIAGGDSFSGIHYVNPRFAYLHPKWGLTQIQYFVKSTDNFVNQGRDGTQHGGGFTHIYLLPGSQHYVGLGYQVSDEDTEGRFDRLKHDFKVLGRLILPLDIKFNGEYKFSLRKYDAFAADNPGAVREDEQHNYRVRVTKMLTEQWGFMEKLQARFEFLHQNNQSNFSLRDYKTNRFSWGLEARF